MCDYMLLVQGNLPLVQGHVPQGRIRAFWSPCPSLVKFQPTPVNPWMGLLDAPICYPCRPLLRAASGDTSIVSIEGLNKCHSRRSTLQLPFAGLTDHRCCPRNAIVFVLGMPSLLADAYSCQMWGHRLFIYILFVLQGIEMSTGRK